MTSSHDSELARTGLQLAGENLQNEQYLPQVIVDAIAHPVSLWAVMGSTRYERGSGGSDLMRFEHVVVPVASEPDADATCAALAPYLADLERVTAVHAIEKAGGAPDKAPMEKRRSDAAEFLAVVESRLASDVAVDTETVFGTDVVDALFDAALDANADAVVFRPRGGSRIVRLLSGDTATRLVTHPPIPVVSLPSNGDEQ